MSRLSYFCVAALMAGLVLTNSLSAQGRGRGGGFGGGGQGGLARLAGNEAVQKEIGVTDEQKAKLKTLGEEAAKEAQEEASAAGLGAGGFQNLSPEERAKVFEKVDVTFGVPPHRTATESSDPSTPEAHRAERENRSRELGG